MPGGETLFSVGGLTPSDEKSRTPSVMPLAYEDLSALDVLNLARQAWLRTNDQLHLEVDDLTTSAPGGTSVPADNPSRVGPDTGGIQRAGAETPAATTGTDRPPNSGLSTPPAPPEPLPPAGGEPQTHTTKGDRRKTPSRASAAVARKEV